MRNYEAQQIRNVALIAHRGAGKTTLAEAMLHAAGAIEKMGSIEAGNTCLLYTSDAADE